MPDFQTQSQPSCGDTKHAGHVAADLGAVTRGVFVCAPATP